MPSDEGKYTTDLYMSDLHGEYDLFLEIIKKRMPDRLHIVGDIFDRGSKPHLIMDFLADFKNYDVQWGNHDVVWMGAVLGSISCITNIIRNSLRYDELGIIEEGYGIDMSSLASFAARWYADDPCTCYKIKDKEITDDADMQLTLKMHKAITIIQFKAEGQLIGRRPEFDLKSRLLLDKIDYKDGTVEIDGKKYELLDKNYPTIDPSDPYKFTEEEGKLCENLKKVFETNDRLKRHMAQLVANGGMYKVDRGVVMYHACVPMTSDGDLRAVNIYGKSMKGKNLFDGIENCCKKAFGVDDSVREENISPEDIACRMQGVDEETKERGADLLWYLWNAPGAPTFGKDKMATLERYLLKDKEPQKEVKDPYYNFIKDENVTAAGKTYAVVTAEKILKEFGVCPDKGVIINGHVPVKQKNGESPLRGGGKIICIDGGLARTYRKDTGIAGYALFREGEEFDLFCYNDDDKDEFMAEKSVYKFSI